ncbi:MAG: class I SAM-dependent methyltransferase [Acidimicrobiales bacterium]
MPFDGDEYQSRFDRLAATGADVHGEARFVETLDPRPTSVLDAGCGTGRVAIELAQRGIEVVGIDKDESMLAVARERSPDLSWTVADLCTVSLGRTFDVVLMAGNVPLFTPPGTHASLVVACGAHVAPGGALVAGFQLHRGYLLETYDQHCQARGLHLTERYATWGRAPFPGDDSYAVSVHRRPPA